MNNARAVPSLYQAWKTDVDDTVAVQSTQELQNTTAGHRCASGLHPAIANK
jgi:hypothetical protein